MNASGWTQLILFSVILLALTKPMGLYLVRVLDAQGRTFLDPVLKPVERLIYRLAGIDPEQGAGLERLRRLRADLQPGHHAADLFHPAAAMRAAP